MIAEFEILFQYMKNDLPYANKKVIVKANSFDEAQKLAEEKQESMDNHWSWQTISKINDVFYRKNHCAESQGKTQRSENG